jgi:hypothetical protein
MSVATLSSQLFVRSCKVNKTTFETLLPLLGHRHILKRPAKAGTMAVNSVNGVNGTRPKHDFSALKVNQSRLLDAIHTGCKYGAAHRYGE